MCGASRPRARSAIRPQKKNPSWFPRTGCSIRKIALALEAALARRDLAQFHGLRGLRADRGAVGLRFDGQHARAGRLLAVLRDLGDRLRIDFRPGAAALEFEGVLRGVGFIGLRAERRDCGEGGENCDGEEFGCVHGVSFIKNLRTAGAGSHRLRSPDGIWPRRTALTVSARTVARSVVDGVVRVCVPAAASSMLRSPVAFTASAWTSARLRVPWNWTAYW